MGFLAAAAPFIPEIIEGGAVLGGALLGSRASNKATDASTSATNQALAFQREQATRGEAAYKQQWEQLALMAKYQATAVFRRTTVTGVQIHGGMGFSSEADPQLYYRRAKHLQLMYWQPRDLERRIADKVFG